jgi:hypothetical protein
MFISITTGRLPKEKLTQMDAFLGSFLPRMRQFPGVKAIYFYSRPDSGDASTIVIWESQEALENYRQSELIKEAFAFEQEYSLPGTREAYPLIFSL